MLIHKCLNPNCRFRFPSEQKSSISLCPKCGSPVANLIDEIENLPQSQNVDEIRNFAIDVLLDNIRSAYNVGSILRSANGAGVAHIHLCGITPTPDHAKVQKTALDLRNQVPWTQHWNAIDVVKKAKNHGLQICTLETHRDSTSIFDLSEINLSFPIMLVMGNELSGVDPEILHSTDLVINIPMYGEKKSLNVSSAFAIAIYFIRKIGRKSWEQSN